MSRLLTCGFETGDLISDGLTSTGGTKTVVTAPVASGRYALQIPTDPAVNSYVSAPYAMVGGRTYYMRARVRISGTPTSDTMLLGFGASSSLSVAQNLGLYLAAGSRAIRCFGGTSVRGSTGPELAVDNWYLLELAVVYNSTTNETMIGRVDGAEFASVSAAMTVSLGANFWAGVSTNAGITVTVDDWAVNDDQGSSQNSWPGNGKIVLLRPVADNVRNANWTAGAGSTSNLYNAVDNTPPVGVALASATDASQIKNAAVDNSGVYAANCAAYSTVIGSADTVVLVQPFAVIGNSGTSARSLGVSSTDNPATVEVVANTPAVAAGTFPTNWIQVRGVVAVGDIADRSFGPVVQLRKDALSADALMACLMGANVEYLPPSSSGPVVEVTGVGKPSSTWTDPDGIQWALSETGDHPGWFTTRGPAGWGAPPYEIVTDPLSRGGVRVRFIRAEPARITWPLHIWGRTHLEFVERHRSLRRAFIKTLHMATPGILRVTRPDGSSREIQAYYEDGFTGEGGGEDWLSANPVLTLMCPDGYWRDAADTVLPFSYGVGTNFLAPYPQVSASQVIGGVTIENPGEVAAWPVWTIAGPMVAIQAINNTTGQSFELNYALGAGQTITITTEPPTATGPGGDSIIGALNWPSAYLWPLVSGSNSLQFNVSGAAAGTQVTLAFRARYEGA